jgi:hypothetical protein
VGSFLAAIANTKKTAVELAQLIRSHLAQPELRVAVYPKVTGWHARVYVEEVNASEVQKRVDDVVKSLNTLYDLES